LRLHLAVAAAVSAAAAFAAQAAPTAVLTMGKMAYGAPPAGLAVGQRLTFRNEDLFEHTATSPGDFDLDLKPGERGSVVLKRPGVYAVFCRFHPTMQVRLIVRPAPETHP
jgi:plastocyanin